MNFVVVIKWHTTLRLGDVPVFEKYLARNSCPLKINSLSLDSQPGFIHRPKLKPNTEQKVEKI